LAAMIAPCSVKAYGRYFIFCPRFKVANCDLGRGKPLVGDLEHLYPVQDEHPHFSRNLFRSEK
jgi:hypothetical protein